MKLAVGLERLMDGDDDLPQPLHRIAVEKLQLRIENG